jgi:CRP-like cAMP-binding protein
MNDNSVFFDSLSQREVSTFLSDASRESFPPNTLVFSEGDQADSFYIIESGCVRAFFLNHGQETSLSVLGKGDCFGEMALLNNDRRSASVMTLEDTTVLCINRDTFLGFTQEHPTLADKVNHYIVQRNEELILRENLIDTTGIDPSKLYVSIKGDPSLRETALFRERYESVVDRFRSQLIPNLQELILDRGVYQFMVNMNSGEVRTSSVFDPFIEEIHTSERLIDPAYINRHFPVIDYEEKIAFIRSVYALIPNIRQYGELPEQWRNIFGRVHSQWQPLVKEEIRSIMSKIVELRDVPNFYLRNFSISIVQDAIRMQFNCDGTHIMSSQLYNRFLEDNFELNG